jgi:G3E family GTPase
LRPHVPVLQSAQASLPAATLLEELARAKAAPAPACALDHAHGPHCAHDDHHDAGHTHLADVTTAFAPLETMSRTTLEGAIALVLKEFGHDLLRMKGIVRLSGEATLQVVQAEAGVPVEFTPLPARPADEPATGITLIARGQPARDMAAALRSCLMSAEFASREGQAHHV